MYVQFITDAVLQNEGFIAEVLFTYDESKGCGGTIRLNQSNNMSSYVLRAPKLPVNTNLDCGWLVTVEPWHVVEVQVITYTETPKCPFNVTDCRCSSIQFLDGPMRMASKIRQFCSSHLDYPSILSSGSKAFLRYRVMETDIEWNSERPIDFRVCHKDHEFDLIIRLMSDITLKLHTDEQKTSRGFRLEFKSERCQTTHDKPYGRISIESFIDMECTFTINPGLPNATISLYFTKLRIFKQSSVETNHLKVYDGPNVSSPLVFTLTDRHTLVPSVFSTGPFLTVWYKMTYQRLWMLEISYTSTEQGRGCGGRLFHTEGTVTSPLYPLVYRKNTTCRWDITVPRPYAVEIIFRVVDFGKRTSCDTDYLEMYNVDRITDKSSFVAKYCGRDTPAIHVSQTGAVLIRYVTTVHNSGSGWLLQFTVKNNV